MIKLLRIDDRLVHGQVAFSWTSSLGADTLLVANDKASKDEFMKMTMNLAKPQGKKMYIKSVADAIAYLKDEKSAKSKVFVVVDSVKDAFDVVNGIDEIKSVNFGGIRKKPDRKMLTGAIALGDEDVKLIYELLDKDIKLEVRQLPTDKEIDVKSLIKNWGVTK